MQQSWHLSAACRNDAQGLIVSGFAHLHEGVALLLDATQAPGGDWLRAVLGGGLTVTPASGRAMNPDGTPAGCAAFALTASGLEQLRLDKVVLNSFAQPFLESMHATSRRARLRDDTNTARNPEQPYWGGNGHAPQGIERIACTKTVHAVIILYDSDAGKLETRTERVAETLRQSGVVITHRLPLLLDPVQATPGTSRENFGFADGISQPLPYGASIVTSGGTAYPADPIHGIQAGDIMLGHMNGHGEPAPFPVIPAELDAAPAARNFGLNGSYLVIRELSQDVDAFWHSMEQAAHSAGAPSATWMAERVIGRTQDGLPLSPSAPDSGNDFLYWQTDRDGLHCPLGAHIRRVNPRDSLAPAAVTTATSLSAVNNHRILRRGRKYPAYQLPGDAKALPGLLFMCLNTDIERQFEFVQETWMLNGSFQALFGERDPLLGAETPFTIPTQGVRLRPAIGQAVRFVGGEYFFLPSLTALNYFAGLP